MKLLLDERGKILFVRANIEFGIWDEPNVEKWKVGANEFALDNNYSVVEVDNVPLDVIPGKYFYIDGKFVTDPNYVSRDELEKKLIDMESSVEVIENAMCEDDTLDDERISAIEDALCEISMMFG